MGKNMLSQDIPDISIRFFPRIWLRGALPQRRPLLTGNNLTAVCLSGTLRNRDAGELPLQVGLCRPPQGMKGKGHEAESWFTGRNGVRFSDSGPFRRSPKQLVPFSGTGRGPSRRPVLLLRPAAIGLGASLPPIAGPMGLGEAPEPWGCLRWSPGPSGGTRGCSRLPQGAGPTLSRPGQFRLLRSASPLRPPGGQAEGPKLPILHSRPLRRSFHHVSHGGVPGKWRPDWGPALPAP